MQASVLIPTLNYPRVKDVCEAVLAQTGNSFLIEILVVGVDDRRLVPEHPLIRLVATPRAWNAAQKRNLAMKEAQGSIFCFLDADCIPDSNWLMTLLRHHETGRKVVGGAVYFGNRPYLQCADNISAFHDLLPHTSAGHRPYLATANLSVHKSVPAEIGMLPTHLDRAHDLAWTAEMRRHGYRLYFEPAARVKHVPPRHTATEIWSHWIQDAPDTLAVRLEYATELGTPTLARQRWPFLWLSLLIAAWSTLKTFHHRQALLRFGHTLPAVYLTKLAWCWSAHQSHPNRQERRRILRDAVEIQ